MTTREQVRYAMGATWQICDDPVWRAWAAAWLGGDADAMIDGWLRGSEDERCAEGLGDMAASMLLGAATDVDSADATRSLGRYESQPEQLQGVAALTSGATLNEAQLAHDAALVLDLAEQQASRREAHAQDSAQGALRLVLEPEVGVALDLAALAAWAISTDAVVPDVRLPRT